MKKTQRIEVFRIIRKTLVSYVSIAVFVMLGVAIYAGISWGSDSILKNAERAAVTEGNLHDLELYFPYGAEEEDLERLREVDGADTVEGSRCAYQLLRRDGESYYAALYQITAETDTFVEVEGTIPAKEDEIAVDTKWAETAGIKIGDVLTFEDDNDGELAGLALLKNYDGDLDRYTEKAEEYSKLADHPSGLRYFKNKSFTVTAVVSYPQYLTLISGVCPENGVAVNAAMYVPECAWSEETDLGYTSVRIRSDALREYSVFDDAYKDHVRTLQSVLQPVADELAQRQYEKIRSNADLILRQTKTRLEDAKKTLDESESRFRAMGLITEEGDFLTEEQTKAMNLPPEVTEGLRKLSHGREEYEDGVSRYRELEESFASIESHGASITNAKDVFSILSFETLNTAALNMRMSMSLMFVLVGLLVCHSTVSRLVYDQTVLIGTKKALGLSRKQITMGQLAYSVSAAVLGCVLGALLGVAVAWIILQILLGASFPGEMRVYTDFRILLVLCAVQLLLVLVTTLAACGKILKKRAIELLQGTETVQGKQRFFEKWAIWNHMPLLMKTIINNCLNDKRRVRGTLVGITCCCALMVVALTMYLNGMQGYSIQKNDYYRFDHIVYFDNSDPKTEEEISGCIRRYGFDAEPVKMTMVDVDVPEGYYLFANVIAPSDREHFSRLSHMVPAEPTDMSPSEGTWMCASYLTTCEEDHPAAVTGIDSAGKPVTVPVDVFYNNYSSFGEIVMDPAEYESVFGEDYAANCFILNSDGKSLDALSRELEQVDGYYYIRDFIAYMDRSYDMFKNTIFAIVGVSMALSVVMAFLVILNLLSMFVSEKKRELIILRINGYSVGNVKKYIYSDTIALSVLSILLGTAVGTVVGIIAVTNLQNATLQVICDGNIAACLIAAAITAILVFFSSVNSLKTVSSLKLTDINK